MFGRKNHSATAQAGPDVPVYAGDGTALGVVFPYEDLDCTDPGLHWYALSYATSRQVGPAFATEEEATNALRASAG